MLILQIIKNNAMITVVINKNKNDRIIKNYSKR